MDRTSLLTDGETGAVYHKPAHVPDRTCRVLTVVFILAIIFVSLAVAGIVIGTTVYNYTRQQIQDQYDYIIVGAGAAGCVLAARLTENPNVRVLLLEAGGPSQVSTGGTDYASVSMRYDQQKQKYYYSPITRVDVPLLWVTIPWNDGLGYNWPKLSSTATLGRTLGGGSSVNAMIYVRGIKQDFDSWNMTYWSWPEVLDLYKRSENNTSPRTNTDSTYHSTSGPMHVGDRRYEDYPGKLFVTSCWNRGHPNSPDFNGASREGCGFYQFNQVDGQRDGTANAFLAPAMSRPNLIVKTYSAATKINFDSNNQATSVNYVPVNPLPPLYNDSVTTYVASATKEIILSAGAIHSPRLLLLSGVGPASDLQAM
jgi:choline dehydrogenase